MKLVKELKTTERSICEELIDNEIKPNKDGFYEIPKDLILSEYPEGVVNSFLDFFKDSTLEEFNSIIEMIKSGEVKMECKE